MPTPWSNAQVLTHRFSLSAKMHHIQKGALWEKHLDLCEIYFCRVSQLESLKWKWISKDIAFFILKVHHINPGSCSRIRDGSRRVYIHVCVYKQPRVIILMLMQRNERAGVSDACSHSFWSALMINANFKSLAGYVDVASVITFYHNTHAHTEAAIKFILRTENAVKFLSSSSTNFVMHQHIWIKLMC